MSDRPCRRDTPPGLTNHSTLEANTLFDPSESFSAQQSGAERIQSLKPAQLLELHAKVSAAAAGRKPCLFESAQKAGSIARSQEPYQSGFCAQHGTRAILNKHTPIRKLNRFLIRPGIPTVLWMLESTFKSKARSCKPSFFAFVLAFYLELAISVSSIYLLHQHTEDKTACR